MKLTYELMESLGCDIIALGDDNWRYSLNTKEYQFHFEQDTHDNWIFYTPSGIRHHINTIEECFGIIQADAIGESEKSSNLFLEIK